MTYPKTKRLRMAIILAPLSMAMGLAACGDDDNDDIVLEAPTPTPTMSPTPSPTPTTAGFNVTPCLQQEIPGTGATVAEAVVPDTLTLTLSAPSGFPNGRKLADPVIDVTLAVIFLDLSVNGPGTLAGIPLNPPANDVAFRSGFPFLAAAQGNPPLASSNGSGFTFRNATRNQYVRVDRMGMPAVATALIGTDQKLPYNDADPADDAAGQFVPELAEQLTGLTNALADDLVGAGLTPCATQN